VDTGNPGDGKSILKEVEEAGYRPEDISLIILTHGHRDHAGGVGELRQSLNPRILVGESDAGAVTGEEPPELIPLGFKGRLLKTLVSLAPGSNDTAEEVELDEIGTNEVGLHGFGIEGKIIPTPGHTRGSLSVLLEDGSAIVGDLVMPRFLFFGRAGLPVFVEDRTSLKNSLERVLAAEPDRIYASHGGPYEPEELKRLLRGLS
jgi:glyoxylase-like metal-dependent hydrolase (beta-lactamase superfamily II)